jgi:hypothetical protein
MAKIKPTVTPLSGKLGDVVHVDSRRYGHHARKPVAPGTKKNEPAFKEQHARTAYLNTVASDINTIIKAVSGRLKPASFYEELHRRLRKEPLNNRFLLLLQLKGMEVNPAYPMNKSGSQVIDVKNFKNKIVVSLQVKSHPQQGKQKADCYYYETILVTWDKTTPGYSRQLSDWVQMNNGKPEFEFEFARTAATTHWLLCLRLQLGLNKQPVTLLAADGIQLVNAGSLNKKDYQLLKKKEADEVKAGESKAGEKHVEEIVRIKAKRLV